MGKHIRVKPMVPVSTAIIREKAVEVSLLIWIWDVPIGKWGLKPWIMDELAIASKNWGIVSRENHKTIINKNENSSNTYTAVDLSSVGASRCSSLHCKTFLWLC